MSGWDTLLVKWYSVYCSQGNECPKEFSDFDAAVEFMEQMRERYPNAAVEISAVIDA